MKDQALKSTFQAFGLRLSQKRLALFDVLISNGSKLITSEDVYRQLCDQGHRMNTSSIAHALVDLERVGLLKRINGPDRRARFQCATVRPKAVLEP